MIIIQTTVDEEKKAKGLINLLLETNKIACGTFNKIQSSYIWKEELIKISNKNFISVLSRQAALLDKCCDNYKKIV